MINNRKKYIYKIWFLAILQVLLLVGNGPVLRAQSLMWFRQAGSLNAQITGQAVSTDSEGNIYVAGNFTGTLPFGAVKFNTLGNQDMFLAKYSSQGRVLWAKQAGGIGNDAVKALQVDDQGNIYITGAFSSTANFEGTSLTSVGGTDIFIAKYDTDGNFRWVKRIGGSQNDTGNAIETDDKGNIYVTGTYKGSVDFLGEDLTAVGGDDVFFSSLDRNGRLLWVRKAGSINNDAAHGLCATNKFIYVTGAFRGESVFHDTIMRPSSGEFDYFLAQYAQDGQLNWVRQEGGKGNGFGQAIDTDAQNNVYVVGNFTGNLDVDTSYFDSHGLNDIFLIKYDTAGTKIWMDKAGGINNDVVTAMKVDKQGNLYMAGAFVGIGVFDTLEIMSNSSKYDIFLVKYNTTGSAAWAFKAGGNETDAATALALDKDESILMTGAFYALANFGAPFDYPGAGDYNFFLAKYGLDKKTAIDPLAVQACIHTFPNPVHDVLNLQIPQSWAVDKATVSLYNMQGQTVLRHELSASDLSMPAISISTKGIKTGMYLLQISSEKGLTGHKIVIQ